MTALPQSLSPTVLQSMVESSLDGILIIERRWFIAYANPAACLIFGRTPEELVGRSFMEFIAESYRERQALRSSSDRPGLYDTVIARPDGEERTITYSAEWLPAQGEESNFAILRDVTEDRRAELQARTVASLAARMTLAQPPAELLQDLAREVCEAVDAEAAAFLVQEGEALRFSGTYGLSDGFIAANQQLGRSDRSQGRRGLAERAVESQQVQIWPNFRATILASAESGPLRSFVEAAAWETVVNVPLSYRRTPLGALAIFFAPNVGIEAGRIAFLQAIADQTALMLQNARLFEQARGKAALEERQRLARELHDSVSQALYGITLGARAAIHAAKNNPQGLQAPLEYISSLAETGIAEMRALIFELRPESLAEEGVVAALARQAAALRARYETEIVTDFGAEPELPLELKEMIYRIAQEALHNIVKHAEARCIKLVLNRSGNTLVLEVEDDGKGFDPTGAFPGHLGQRSMRERAGVVGAQLLVDSEPGRGTRIRLELPCEA